jgi:hypothetical protein
MLPSDFSSWLVRMVTARRRMPIAGSAHRGLQHLLAPERVHVDEGDAELPGGAHRARHRVRDVVELEVEEDLLPARDHLAHEVGTSGGEDLAAHLEHTDVAGQPVHHGTRRRRVRHVESDDQPVARRHPPSSSAAGRPG